MAKDKTKATLEAFNASPTHLLHRALQLALDFHGEAAGPEAITQRQFTVLAAAAQSDGMTQNDLVRSTGIDRSTLADLVSRMLTKGLLERERSTTDARANTVRLSPAGRLALTAGAGASAKADERLLALMPAKRREGFVKGLAALAAHADDPTPKKAETKVNGAAVKSEKKRIKKVKKTKKLRDVGA